MLLTLKLPWVRDNDSRSASSTGKERIPELAVVAAVDQDKGEITLVHPGGTPSCLTAHPSLLQDVRQWGVVRVLTEGTVIRGLRCL
jgi:hypothetical protein